MKNKRGARVKRELAVAVAGTAIVVAGVSGCSSNKSSTSSESAGSSATAAASGTSVVPEDMSWNITVNNQAVAQGVGANKVACGKDGDDPIHIMVGSGTGTYVDLTKETLEVEAVSISDDTGASYLFDPEQQAYHWGGGDAQATRSGKTYKITGHIAPYMNVQGQIQKDATPVPFEFVATCP
jgi:lipoprotein LpqH